MQRFTKIFALALFLIAAIAHPAFAGSGTVLKKGNKTLVVYQSQGSADQHWLERNGRRSKLNGSAESAVNRYIKKGYVKSGSKAW